jgi:transposase
MLTALSLCCLLFLEDDVTTRTPHSSTAHTDNTDATPTPRPKAARQTKAQTPPAAPPHAAPDTAQTNPDPKLKAHKKRQARAHAKAETLRHSERAKVVALPVCNPHAAGIDLGSSNHWVCVGYTQEPSSDLIREFATHTDALRDIVAYLRQHQVTTVALEASGVYWIAPLELLVAEGFEVLLVPPQYTRQVRGRPKTDRHDCQWIYRLHSVGLLPGAFRPDEATCILRSLLRQRGNIIRAGAKHIQHMQKELEQMNLKLTTVLDDITGLTGQQIIRAILKGTRDPLKLASLRDPHCKANVQQIAQALDGSYRDDHLFVLRQSYEAWQFGQKQLDKLDEQIAQQLARMKRSGDLPPLPPKKRTCGRKPNDPRFDVREALYRVLGVDLTELEGFRASTALTLISEIGRDLSAFATVKHFCAWLGLCPQLKKTGGKVKSSATRRGQGRAAATLRLAASSLHNSQSGLGGYLRRMKGRLGAPAAVTATAHKLARLVYYSLRHGLAYVRQTQEAYDRQQRDRQVAQLKRKARQLGLEVKEQEPSSCNASTSAATGAPS